MIKETWFETPIWYADLPYDFSSITKKFLELQSQDDGVVLTNRNGYQSKDLSENTDFEIQGFLSAIESEANKIFATLEHFKPLKLKISNSWVNINHPGAYNVAHCHPGAHFSSVVYLNVPENSGNIVFQRNDKLNDYISTTFPVFQRAAVYRPRNNMMLVFPGWIHHDVEQNKSNQNRISVASNYVLQLTY